MVTAKLICLVLLIQAIAFARSFALLKAGKSIAARIAIIAITTKSSISVKAEFGEVVRVDLEGPFERLAWKSKLSKKGFTQFDRNDRNGLHANFIVT